MIGNELYEDTDDFIIFTNVEITTKSPKEDYNEYIISELVDKSENNNQIAKDCHQSIITYGSDTCFINVTEDVFFCFKNDNQLIILKTYSFNEYFGDPHYGVVKNLILNINGIQYVIGENRDSDFILNLDTGNILEGTFADIDQLNMIQYLENQHELFSIENQQKSIIEI